MRFLSVLFLLVAACVTKTATNYESKQEIRKFARDLLNLHNEYRRKHGVPALSLNSELIYDARRWASIIAKSRTLKHDKDLKGYGENLAVIIGHLNVETVAKMWYDEIEYYNFDRPGFSFHTGHFSQLVWNSTKEFGAAYSKTPSGSFYIVARYYPPGNINTPAAFRANVFPPQ